MGSVKRFLFFAEPADMMCGDPSLGWKICDGGGHTKMCERACFSWAISGVKSLTLKLQFQAITT